MPTTEYRIQNTEYRIQNTEYRIQKTKYRIQIPNLMVKPALADRIEQVVSLGSHECNTLPTAV